MRRLVDPHLLVDSSKTLAGGDLWSYLTSRLEQVRRGKLRATVTAALPLREGAAAHRLWESRQSTGKILLHP